MAGTGGAAGSGAAGTTGAAGAAGAGAAGASGASALQTAELASGFDPNALTYKHSQDSGGNQSPIGWGPSTLPSQAQADAATALIRRIGVLLPDSVRNSSNSANAVPGTPNNPSSDDPDPISGLLTLNADPNSVFSGTNLAPAANTALEAFRAAAIADSAVPKAPNDPGGLSSTAAANNATLGAYIATETGDPSSAIGLAANVVRAAVQYGLETQLQAF